MIDIKHGWKSVADREKWAARGASLVAKAKATKAVWFPPKPTATGKKSAATAKKASKTAAKKSTQKTASAAKKTTKGTKKVTSPVARKKS